MMAGLQPAKRSPGSQPAVGNLFAGRQALLQRKCACGGAPGQSGECEACRRKREGPLQRKMAESFLTTLLAGAGGKLHIDRPDSASELEADRLASAVMNGTAAGPISSLSAARTLQRQEAGIIPSGPLQVGVPKGALERRLPERKPGTPRGTYPVIDPVGDPCLKGERCNLAISGSNIDYYRERKEDESQRSEALRKEGKSVALVPAPEMTRFLKRETPQASGLLREVLADPSVEGGAWSRPCPDDQAAMCVTVSLAWEQEALQYNTDPSAEQFGKRTRAEWRFTTRQMLTHEAAHVRFARQPPPGTPAFEGTTNRATISHKELSELFAQLGEFPVFYEEGMAGDGPQHEKLQRVRQLYSERYLQRTMKITEDIPGILLRLRCLNPCREVDMMLTSLFNSVSATWPPNVRQALLGILTDPALELHWPAPPQPRWNLKPEPEGLRFESNPLQRKAATDSLTKSDAAAASVDATLHETGQPLDASTRVLLEPRFGHDFSEVRVHTDAKACESARLVNALAYTVGHHVVFGTGQYHPESPAGQRLLAHELTHVVQQGARPLSPADLQLARQENESRPAAESPGVVETQETPPGTPPGDARDERGAEGTGESGSPTAQATSVPSCAPAALSRQEFLRQAGTSLSEFGLTTLDVGQVTFPSLQTTAVRGGVQVQPTTASLPNIRSIFTGAGTFTEGTIRAVGGGDRECPEGTYPQRWTITPEGARQIQAGEQEHCDDFNLAFDISVARFRDAINQIAASGRTFRNEAAVKRHLQSVVGFSFDDMQTVFVCLAEKTRIRDGRRRDWHTPRPLRTPPSRFSGCAHARAVIGQNSLPQVGQHPSSEIIQGCGETPVRRGAGGRRPGGEPRQPAEGERK